MGQRADEVAACRRVWDATLRARPRRSRLHVRPLPIFRYGERPPPPVYFYPSPPRRPGHPPCPLPPGVRPVSFRRCSGCARPPCPSLEFASLQVACPRSAWPRPRPRRRAQATDPSSTSAHILVCPPRAEKRKRTRVGTRTGREMPRAHAASEEATRPAPRTPRAAASPDAVGLFWFPRALVALVCVRPPPSSPSKCCARSRLYCSHFPFPPRSRFPCCVVGVAVVAAFFARTDEAIQCATAFFAARFLRRGLNVCGPGRVGTEAAPLAQGRDAKGGRVGGGGGRGRVSRRNAGLSLSCLLQCASGQSGQPSGRERSVPIHHRQSGPDGHALFQQSPGKKNLRPRVEATGTGKRECRGDGSLA